MIKHESFARTTYHPHYIDDSMIMDSFKITAHQD
ncbi:unnamed protein product [Larinioides sclopetarius]|uniref:Uncharacterized protein n=1 Tax=Larinioides sclopetarius TaxID=280406 RepID=A0AAV2A5W8_9ARAC